MISEFDKVRIENIEEEANPDHYVSVDATGKLFKYAIPLKPIADAWPIGGLNVRGYGTNVPILGIYYTAPPETVTMEPAPTTANWLRRDTVAVNTLNRIVILPGTPGLVGAAPVVDLNLYFPIRDLLLLANATEPVDPGTGTGNSNEFVLFAETGTVAGGEANVSGSAATIAVTANTQIAGAKSIEATNVQKLHEARFEYLELKSTVGQTHFIYKLKLKATVQKNKYWFFRLYNGNSTIGNFLFKHGQYGFDADQLGIQYLSIPIEVTPFKNVSYTKATLFFYHGYSTIPGYYLDDVKFLNSLPTIIYADQVQSDWDELDQNKVTYIKGRFDQTLKEDKANKGLADGYAPLNASVKIAATYLDIVNDLLTGGVDKLLSAEQGVVLQGQLNSITSILFSDNVNLDTVQEIVDAIESVQSYLDTILVNDLTTGGATKALTAEMGKSLKLLYDALALIVADKEDVSNKSQTIETDKASTTKYGSVKAFYDWAVGKFQAILVSGTNIKTINGVPILGSGDITVSAGGSGDMILANVQTVSGLKTFLQDKIGFRNTADTFTSFFRNANTAARVYTLPNKDGTVAMTSDLFAQMSGVVNYLVKFGTAKTGVVSRLWDTGTYFGIGTANTPIKDITLGNQGSKEIGIEQSDSTTSGKDLIISAGRTINFLLNAYFAVDPIGNAVWEGTWTDRTTGDNYICTYDGAFIQELGVGGFVPLSLPGVGAGYSLGGCVTDSNDLYVTRSATIWKQTNRTGNFVKQTISSPSFLMDMCSTTNGDVYASQGSDPNTGGQTGDIYKQTGGTGSFVAMGFPSRDYRIDANGNDVFVSSEGGIYKIISGTTTLTSLAQTSKAYKGIAVDNIGDYYAIVRDGDLYKSSGGGNLVATGQTSKKYNSLSISKQGVLISTIFSGDVYTLATNALGTSDLDGGTLKLKAGTGKGTGKSRYQIVTGQKTVSGTDMQIETVRAEFDEDGNYTRFSTPIYADNASAIAGGLTAGMEYRTATGIKMEVF
jgi:hypothetical protein